MALRLAVPRAAHAVASVLVQTTNAAANPVPNRDVDQPDTHLLKSADPSAAERLSAPAGQRVVVQCVNAKVDAPGCGDPKVDASRLIFLACAGAGEGV